MIDDAQRHTAVVVLDCQEGVAERVFASDDDRRAFAASVVRLLDLAAQRAWSVVRVHVEFRPGHPEIPASNAYFAGVKQAQRLEAGTPAVAIMAELASRIEIAPLVVKRRIGAMTGTELEQILRGLGAERVILAGLITRGAVLSTACLAADLDYRVAVAEDACFDPDDEVHRILMRDVISMRAEVLTVDQLAGVST